MAYLDLHPKHPNSGALCHQGGRRLRWPLQLAVLCLLPEAVVAFAWCREGDAEALAALAWGDALQHPAKACLDCAADLVV